MQRRQAAADGDADRAAQHADHDRLDQELGQDVAPPRANRFADADLARALGDTHQHDVHDPDPADDKRNAGDGAQQQA